MSVHGGALGVAVGRVTTTVVRIPVMMWVRLWASLQMSSNSSETFSAIGWGYFVVDNAAGGIDEAPLILQGRSWL